jgi:hypothetical protein
MRRLIGFRARDAIATIVAEIKHVRHLADSTGVLCCVSPQARSR